MNAIAQITASKDICQTLVKLGITPRAFFWHLKEGDKWDVWELEEPVYTEGESVPAWTKEELDIMLGGDHGVPILPETRYTKVEVKDEKTVYRYQYIFYDIKKMYAWERVGKTFINPGAQASATILQMALGDNWFTPEEANDRYNQFFKP